MTFMWVTASRLNMHKRIILVSLVILLFIYPSTIAYGQDQPSGPVYVVQSGDMLGTIAYRFGVTVNDLMAANPDVDPNLLGIGMELVIPGMEGVSGRLETDTIALGDSLHTLSRRFQVPRDTLVILNHITSPNEVFAGANLIIPQDEQTAPQGQALVPPGGTLLETSARVGVSPWALSQTNLLPGNWAALPGDALFFAAQNDAPSGTAIPMVTDLSLQNLPLSQGTTVEIRLTTSQPLNLKGSLNGFPLQFFQLDPANHSYVALQGVHAMAKVGLVPFSLSGTADNGQSFHFSQSVLLVSGNYAEDPPLSVDPSTIDPANTKPEEDMVKGLISSATPTRYWQGKFRVPVDEPVCIKSWYGNRRSYNGGPLNYFHTGVDYGVCANLNIYAPAPGVVVFAGPLTVRGNSTIIDHGWGVYSGIFHQSEIQVKTGDRVETGQMIGQIGATGRVTGPHLHWDLVVNGIQVQPLDWLENVYPAE